MNKNGFYFHEMGCGKTLVFLHGIYGSSDYWLPIMKLLSSNYHVVALDLPNHGRSFHSIYSSLNYYTESVKDFIENNNFLSPILIGHSFGGNISINFASKYPEKISRMIIIDAGFRTNKVPKIHTQIQEMVHSINLLEFKTLGEVKKHLLLNLKSEEWANLLLKNIEYKDKRLFFRSNLQVIVNNMNEVEKKLEITNSINPNTLLIYGEYSDYVSSEDIEIYKQKFKHICVTEIKGGDHFIVNKQKEEVCREITRFID